MSTLSSTGTSDITWGTSASSRIGTTETRHHLTSTRVESSESSYSTPVKSSTSTSKSWSSSSSPSSYVTSTLLHSTKVNTLSISSRVSATTTSILPATLLPSLLPSPNQHHTILVASLSSAFVLLVSIVLAIIFICCRRRQNKLATLIQKKRPRAQLLRGEDMSDLESPTASSEIGSFGRDVFGKVISGRNTRRDRGGAQYQNITYAYRSPPPLMTPWDSSRDPRAFMEALHHPSRVQPSEARQYMSQYLSRRAETDTWPNESVSGKYKREIDAAGVASFAGRTRSTSVADLGLIVDGVLDVGSRSKSEWSPVSSSSTSSPSEDDRLRRHI